MLYPDFNDLISYKERKLDKMQLARRKVSSTAPGNHHSPFRGQGLDFDARACICAWRRYPQY